MSRKLIWIALLAASVGSGAAVTRSAAAPMLPTPVSDDSAVIQVQHHQQPHGGGHVRRHNRPHHQHGAGHVLTPPIVHIPHHQRPIHHPRRHHPHH